MLGLFYFYQSTKDGDRAIHQVERFKWPEKPALSGHIFQLTPKVSYLELILEK
jgi:hypothetical protein